MSLQGAAWAGIAHGPEILLQVPDGDDTVRRHLRFAQNLLCFFVYAKRCAAGNFRAAKNGDTLELVLSGIEEPFARERVISSHAYGMAFP